MGIIDLLGRPGRRCAAVEQPQAIPSHRVPDGGDFFSLAPGDSPFSDQGGASIKLRFLVSCSLRSGRSGCGATVPWLQLWQGPHLALMVRRDALSCALPDESLSLVTHAAELIYMAALDLLHVEPDEFAALHFRGNGRAQLPRRPCRLHYDLQAVPVAVRLVRPGVVAGHSFGAGGAARSDKTEGHAQDVGLNGRVRYNRVGCGLVR